MITILQNALVFDGSSAELIEGAHIVIEGDRIREVSDRKVSNTDARVIDCDGRFLMPGLIDAHFHAYTPTFDLMSSNNMPKSLLVSHARVILEGALQRGFTTVRDAGGGDIGLWMAIEAGFIKGPRFYFAGKGISQIGGHGDDRLATESEPLEPCSCGRFTGTLSLVADGVDEVRRAVREQLRQGARQIKLFVSGGILSPTDPVWMPQFTEEEIRAAVYEASTRRTYVMAHCHTDEGARRCLEFGVRSIEHGSQIGDETARMIAAKPVFVVPTLTVIDVMRKHGPTLKLGAMELEKIGTMYDDVMTALEACTRAGVRLGLGTDLLDHVFHELQGSEMALRGQVNKPIDVLRSATSVNADLLQAPGELGCIREGAYADIVVLNGNPLNDLNLFRNVENMPLVMKGGVCARNNL